MFDVHTHINSEETLKSYLKRNPRAKQIITMHFFDNRTTLDQLLDLASKHPIIKICATVDMDKEIGSQLAYLDSLLVLGKIAGIKLYPGYQHFYPSDEKVFPVVEFCQKNNLPVVFHSGDVYDPDGRAMLKYSRPLFIDELAVRYPKCRIVIAHLGFPFMLEAANIISKNDNVFGDISGTIDDVGGKFGESNLLKQYQKDLKSVLNYYPGIQNKIMFGTDYCGEDSQLNKVESYIRLVKKCFDKGAQSKIFSETATKVFA